MAIGIQIKYLKNASNETVTSPTQGYTYKIYRGRNSDVKDSWYWNIWCIIKKNNNTVGDISIARAIKATDSYRSWTVPDWIYNYIDNSKTDTASSGYAIYIGINTYKTKTDAENGVNAYSSSSMPYGGASRPNYNFKANASNCKPKLNFNATVPSAGLYKDKNHLTNAKLTVDLKYNAVIKTIGYDDEATKTIEKKNLIMVYNNVSYYLRWNSVKKIWYFGTDYNKFVITRSNNIYTIDFSKTPINNSNIKFKVVDSRGYQSSELSKSYTVNEYFNPSLTLTGNLLPTSTDDYGNEQYKFNGQVRLNITNIDKADSNVKIIYDNKESEPEVKQWNTNHNINITKDVSINSLTVKAETNYISYEDGSSKSLSIEKKFTAIPVWSWSKNDFEINAPLLVKPLNKDSQVQSDTRAAIIAQNYLLPGQSDPTKNRTTNTISLRCQSLYKSDGQPRSQIAKGLMNDNVSDGVFFAQVIYDTTTKTDKYVLGNSVSDTELRGKLNHTLSLEEGGTGSSSIKDAPNNAIIRKSSTDPQFWYTPTNKGAFYATSENGAPVFGTLPLTHGGTGSAIDLANAPANAIIKKEGSGINSLYYTPTSKGYLYASGNNESAYFKMPTRLELGIQRGIATVGSSGYSTVQFSQSYSGDVEVQATLATTSGWGTGLGDYTIRVTSISNSEFTIHLIPTPTGTNSVAVHWLATGTL